MRNALILITVAAMAVGGVFAQDTSPSLDDIFKTMDDHEPKASMADREATSETNVYVVDEESVSEIAQLDVDPSPASAMEEIDVNALVEESRELYVGGEFEKAQQGFEQIVKIEPENRIAGVYLRQLLERDARQVEETAMEEVREAWDTRLVLRSYTISSDGAAAMGLESARGSTAVDLHFPEVNFPADSSAVYHPSAGKMFVRNTRENLAVLEEILLALDISKLTDDVDQVEIEAKFVEVSEGTLEELGFEWRTAGGEPIQLFGDWYFDANYFLYDDTLRGGPSGPDMPFSRPSDLGSGRAPGEGDWSSTRFADTFNKDPAYLEIQGTSVDVLISALDQSTGADMLSAPRVVTKSGKTAIIRVGELHKYPALYELDTTQATFPNIAYEEFEEKLLGVELEVTPELNGDQIELGLSPVITELAGWRYYEIAPANSIYNHRQDKLHAVYGHEAVTAKLPIFKTREIKTIVTIADGGTIGMGGLITERMESFVDQVPVLGHIPLLGRLFRNEGERAVKFNLLMFVKARRVESTGRINTEVTFE